MKMDLPNGAWALLREADEIPRRQARTFRKVLYKVAMSAGAGDSSTADEAAAVAAAKALMSSDEGLDGIEDMAEALVLAAVSEWSFGDVTAEVLETVPDASVDAINNACLERGYLEKLMPNVGVDLDPDSPTKPSEA